MHKLNQKQRTVLQMLTEGASDLEVSRACGLSLEHLSQILSELQAATIQRPTHSVLVGRFERAMRIRAERRANALDSRFRSLIEVSPLAVLVVDGSNGVIKQANEFAARLFGYAGEELVGLPVENLIDAKQRSRHVAFRLSFLMSIRRRELGYHPPIFAIRADGTEVQLSIALTATAFDDEVMVVCSEFVGNSNKATEAVAISRNG